MALFSMDNHPPIRRGVIEAQAHGFFDDSTVFLALDDNEDEEEESIEHQDTSFLPSEEERLHLETTERDQLKSMCITFRANPFAFQEINHNGLGRRAMAPAAQPHSSPPLLYNFWADPGPSPHVLGHNSRGSRTHPSANSPSHSPMSPPMSPVALAASGGTASHDPRQRPDQPTVRLSPCRSQQQQRHRAKLAKEPSGGHDSSARSQLAIKCEDEERGNPSSLRHPVLHKSPANWYGLPTIASSSSSSSSSSGLQPVTQLSYGELRSRPQNGHVNSYSSWFPHQGPSARGKFDFYIHADNDIPSGEWLTLGLIFSFSPPKNSHIP